MRTAYQNKSFVVTPVDGPDGWKEPKQRTARPAAIAVPPEVKLDLATAIREMPSRIQAVSDEIKAALRRERDQRQAQLELAHDDVKRATLRARAAGKSQASTDLEHFERVIGDLESQIASIDQRIAALDERTKARVERAPRLLSEIAESETAIAKALAALQPVYDALATQGQELRDLLIDVRPNGLMSLVWLPKANDGTSVLSLIKRLEPLFEKDGLVARVLREARNAGLNL